LCCQAHTRPALSLTGLSLSANGAERSRACRGRGCCCELGEGSGGASGGLGRRWKRRPRRFRDRQRADGQAHRHGTACARALNVAVPWAVVHLTHLKPGASAAGRTASPQQQTSGPFHALRCDPLGSGRRLHLPRQRLPWPRRTVNRPPLDMAHAQCSIVTEVLTARWSVIACCNPSLNRRSLWRGQLAPRRWDRSGWCWRTSESPH
jgi:hypothetical protein